jgi:hypothetical protein
MRALVITPEAAIDKIMTQLSELENIPGRSGATAASIISGVKADMTALRRLSVTQRFQHKVRDNQLANCSELYARAPEQLCLSVSN